MPAHAGRKVAVAAAAFACAVAGCGGGAGADQAASDTLAIALPSQPENLNPIYGDTVYEGNSKVFNGLLRYTRTLETVPDLARSLPTRSEDGRVVTVNVRDDVRFSDGQPLTARDVAFTYRTIKDPKSASPLATLLESLDTVQALDRTTVRFTLKRPDPAFYDKLQIGIVPEHLLRGRDLKTAAFNRRPVGTGPYVVDEFEPGGRIVLTANRDHFRGTPRIPRLVLTAVEDENARAALLENGSIDAAGVVPKLTPRLGRDDDLRVVEVPTADQRVIALPNRNPVLRDPRVRQALSLAVDRERMVSGVLAGAGEPGFGPIVRDHWAYSPVVETAFDPAGARRRLEASGWHDRDGDGVREKDGRDLAFTLMYPSDDSVRKDLALAFSSDLARIGVRVNVEGLTFEVIETRQDRDATLFGYGTPYDPDLELYSLFHSSFIEDDDAFTNYANMDNAAIDAALEAERTTLDRAARKRAFARLQQALAEDGSWLYLVRLRHVVAASDRIDGIAPQLEPHAHGFSRGTSWNLERWTLGD